MTNLTELKKLAEAATLGPWREFSFSEVIASTYDRPPYGHMVLAGDGETIVAQSVPNRDVDFIAAANPQAILQMIAVMEQMHLALSTIADSDNWGTDGTWDSSSYPDEIAEDCLAAYKELMQ